MDCRGCDNEELIHKQCTIELDGSTIECDEELVPLIRDLNNSGIKTIYSCAGNLVCEPDENGFINMETLQIDNPYIMFKYNKPFTDILIRENRPYMDIVISSSIMDDDEAFDSFLNSIIDTGDGNMKTGYTYSRVDAYVSYYVPEEYFLPDFMKKYHERCKRDFFKTIRIALDKYNRARTLWK